VTFSRLVASGFGAGFCPVAPGTTGSFVALLLGVPLLLAPAWVLPTALALAVLLGLWAVRAVGVADDEGWIVIDEIAGQWLALLGLAHPTPAGLAAAFVLFRVFDITKPGPVGWADRRHGAAWIIADDLVAGALAGAVLWAVLAHWPGVLG
jgi:phosphatidylglycerophosphatase A